VTRGKPVLLGGDPKNGENILYCTGSNVVIRSLKTPLLTDIYNDHAKDTTVARYAPSGFYIASADVSGKVRIWDTTQAEHPLKLELQVLSGAILDLDWSEDSKRICAVGDGKDKMGAVFQFDTGASTGEITGHSKAITTCHFKPTRPYRVATGSEDFNVNWFEGPPFKFKKSLESGHSRFVNCVRFNPSGTHLVSVGSDKRGVLFDAKEGAKTGELSAENGHAGGIYSASWNKEGDKVLTASADKTCKVWDASTGKCISTFKLGTQTEDQQLGCLWQGPYLVSMSLSGDLTYLDLNNPDKPLQVIKGHNKFVTALTYDSDNKQIITGSYDSVINRWNPETAHATQFSGKGHTNAISQLHVSSGQLYSASWDDSVRVTPLAGGAYSADKIATDGQPADLAVALGIAVAATVNAVQVIRNGKVVSSVKAKDNTAVGISPDSRTVVVGNKDNKLTVYSLEGDQLKQQYVLDHHRGAISRISFSPNGQLWASADTNRAIFVWEANGKEPKVRDWVFHTARVNALAWSPDNVHLASVSLDQSIIVWNAQQPTVRLQQKNAHQGGINAVRWINETTLVTAGQDSAAKTWTVKF